MTGLCYFAVILCILNFLSFWYSVVGVFVRKDGGESKNYRLLQLASSAMWISSVLVLFQQASSFTVNRALALIFFQTVCLVIFWSHLKIVKQNKFSLIFSSDQPAVLVDARGLYKWVRHPFYFTYLICYLSIAVLTKSLLLSLLCSILMVIYCQAARFEENKFLQSDLRDRYLNYQKRTFMLVPKLWTRRTPN